MMTQVMTVPKQENVAPKIEELMLQGYKHVATMYTNDGNFHIIVTEKTNA